MTVEVEYSVPQELGGMGEWQIRMAEQIESNRGFPINEIHREHQGETFIVRVESENLPSQAVENMLSDIEEHLPSNAQHVETREV